MKKDPSMNIALHPLLESESGEVVKLIANSMNPAEGLWADKTIKFHFFCKKNGIEDGRNYFIAKDGESIVGIAGLHCYEWGPPDVVWLGWFAVDPKMQGKRIGYLLMSEVINKARELKYRKLFIETYSSKEFEKAQAFYQRFGFKSCGHIQGYIDRQTDMLVYSMDL